MNTPELDKTFLFADIMGCVRLWDVHPTLMPGLLAQYDALFTRIIGTNRGHLFKTLGDSHYAAFCTAQDALNAAAAIQQAMTARLQTSEAAGEPALHARIALYTGPASERDGDYFGPALNHTARLHELAHGGQTLLSASAYEAIAADIPPGITFADLDWHRLRDIAQPQRIWQMNAPGTAHDFAPLDSLPVGPVSLPPRTTSFVGRGHEIGEVADLLKTRRLVTLTGMGGIGKTRLALQTARQMGDAYTQTALIELAPLTEAALIVPTVTQALAVREERGRPLLQTLIDALRPRRLLLIVDNCEHLIEASARLIETLLKACPSLHVLVTSREVLGLTGEQVYRVPLLSLPDARHETRLAEVLTSESAQLFMERVHASQPDFVLAETEAPLLAALCRRLEGIPLAIELAAALTRRLPLPQLEPRLQAEMNSVVMNVAAEKQPDDSRHQTLQAMLDWSYRLLNPHEQTLLARLSVFAGGWTLEAAGRVGADPLDESSGGVGNSDTSIEEWEVLDLLLALVDKSLVLFEEQPDGTARYRLLETVREFAADRFASGEERVQAQARHRACFLALTQEARLTGSEQAHWMQVLDNDRDNLRVAAQTSLLDADVPTACLLGESLERFWRVRAYWTEGRAFYDAVLTQYHFQLTPFARARLREYTGRMAWAQGELTDAIALLRDALEQFRALDDRKALIQCLGSLAPSYVHSNEVEKAQVLLEEAVVLCREEGDRNGTASTLTNLGEVYRMQGLDTQAQTTTQAALKLWREEGNTHAMAVCLNNLARMDCKQGNLAAALNQATEALCLRRDLNDRPGILWSLEALAAIAAAQGKSLHAVRLLSAVQQGAATLGATRSPSSLDEENALIARLRPTLDEETWERAWAEGAAWTLEEAVSHALA